MSGTEFRTISEIANSLSMVGLLLIIFIAIIKGWLITPGRYADSIHNAATLEKELLSKDQEINDIVKKYNRLTYIMIAAIVILPLIASFLITVFFVLKEKIQSWRM